MCNKNSCLDVHVRGASRELGGEPGTAQGRCQSHTKVSCPLGLLCRHRGHDLSRVCFGAQKMTLPPHPLPRGPWQRAYTWAPTCWHLRVSSPCVPPGSIVLASCAEEPEGPPGRRQSGSHLRGGAVSSGEREPSGGTWGAPEKM